MSVSTPDKPKPSNEPSLNQSENDEFHSHDDLEASDEHNGQNGQTDQTITVNGEHGDDQGRSTDGELATTQQRPAQSGEVASDQAAKEKREEKKKPFYKRPVPMAIIGVIVIAGVIGVGWYYLYSLQFEETDDAFLDGNLVQIAPQISGPVKSLPVDTHDHVQKGDLLVQIDPADYQVALERAQAMEQSAAAQLQQAQAGLALSQAALTVAKADVDQTQAMVDVAGTNHNNATTDLERYQNVDPEAVSQQRVDKATDRAAQTKAELAAAKQKLASSRAKVKSAQAKGKSAQATIETAKAQMQAAKTQIKKAKLQLSYTSIRAPKSGQIAKLPLEEGEYVKPGQALMSLVPRRIWVSAKFKETQITHMRPGQPVTIHIDAYPDRTFQGHVQSLQRGTGSKFSLLPPQNATGNYVKVVQRLPVRIYFDHRPDIASIAPGMSVEPTVKVRHFQWWPWAKPDVVQGEQAVARANPSK